VRDHNPFALTLGTLILGVLPLLASTQAPTDFSGVWVLDSSPTDTRAYGEIRVVRQSPEAVRVTMIDEGTAWIDGRFRDVVRIMPWTFSWNEWAPRRGGPYSSQPRARARWAASSLVLEKSTDRGAGDLVRHWRLDSRDESLIERVGSIDARFTRLSDHAAVPQRAGISVQVSADLSTVRISCPAIECRVVEFFSGRSTGAAALPPGTERTYPVDAELRIEPR
jgi:hypothetical protein